MRHGRVSIEADAMECLFVPPTLSGTETLYLPGQVPTQPQSSGGLTVMNEVTLQGAKSVGVIGRAVVLAPSLRSFVGASKHFS